MCVGLGGWAGRSKIWQEEGQDREGKTKGENKAKNININKRA
jgi:hypothetical protein